MLLLLILFFVYVTYVDGNPVEQRPQAQIDTENTWQGVESDWQKHADDTHHNWKRNVEATGVKVTTGTFEAVAAPAQLQGMTGARLCQLQLSEI
jgi:hypothetical protein